MPKTLSSEQIDALVEFINDVMSDHYANTLEDKHPYLLPELEEKNAAKPCSKQKKDPEKNGIRTIVVSYSPDGDVESSEYTSVSTSTGDVSEFDDSVALVLAAAKLLAKRVDGVDEYKCGRDLMLVLARSYSGLLLKKYLGGAFQ